MSKHESNAQGDREHHDRGPAPLAPDFVSDVMNLARGAVAEPSGGRLVAVTAIAAVFGATVMLADTSRAHSKPLPAPVATQAAFDPSRFILNALLVPALDGDAVPLRWVDPRPASHCEPGSEVRVDGKPLAAGALVPDRPFELDWQAHGCRPLGVGGPRYDGRVRLTVFREDWGLSAMVEPVSLRVGFGGRETRLSQPSAAWLPFIDDDGPAIELTPAGAGA